MQLQPPNQDILSLYNVVSVSPDFRCSSVSSSATSSHIFSPVNRRDKEPSPATPLQHHPKTTMSVVTPAFDPHLATYLANMIAYLWFSPPSLQNRTSGFPIPSVPFVNFCKDILSTTQVSQSVVVLALLFVWKLQQKHSIDPRSGSEYKLTVTALMLANKILDDHTYTNKTWSDLSGLPLNVLNQNEKEFLQGLDFNLYVSHTTFSAWRELLAQPNAHLKSRSTGRKRQRVDAQRVQIPPSAPTSPTHCRSFSNAAATNIKYSNIVDQRIPSHYISHLLQIPSSDSLLQAPQSMGVRPIPSPTWYSNPSQSKGGQTQTRKRKYSEEYFSDTEASRPFATVSGFSILPTTSTSPAGASLHGKSLSSSSQGSSYTTDNTSSASYQPAVESDFAALAQSYGASVNRNPEYLSYYALAAGQPRGKPQVYHPKSIETTHPFLQYPAARPVAPMPGRQAQQTAPQNFIRTSASLSPVHILNMQRTPQTAFKQLIPTPHSSVGSSARLAPPSAPALTASLSAQASPHMFFDYHAHRLAPLHYAGLQIYPPAPSSAVTAVPPPQANELPLVSDHLPYSAFSNSGLPGVLQWPIQALPATRQPSSGWYTPQEFAPQA